MTRLGLVSLLLRRPWQGRIIARRTTALASLLLASVCFGDQPPYQHGISLLHELKYPPDFEHFDYANPSAPKGGSLTLSTTWPVRNFSGAWGTGVSNASGLERTMDRLFVRSADEQSALYGLLVDGVALSEDRKSLYIRLHEAARWHDGGADHDRRCGVLLRCDGCHLDGRQGLPALMGRVVRDRERPGTGDSSSRRLHPFEPAGVDHVSRSSGALLRRPGSGEGDVGAAAGQRCISHRRVRSQSRHVRTRARLLGPGSARQPGTPQLRHDPLRRVSRRHRR